MSDALDALVDLLDLEAIEKNIFRGHTPKEERVRVFGGQVAAQALVAAARTVDPDPERGPRLVHSLHAYFLRAGDPTIPILYDVDRIRDGKSFSTRRVVAIQRGEAIFNLQASFQTHDEGPEYGFTLPADALDPESLPDFMTRMAPFKEKMGDWYSRPRAIDMRYEKTAPLERRDDRSPFQRVWLRADGRLPDDPVLHACVLTYASDMTLLDTTLLPHGVTWEDFTYQMASLDHAMWFHRPFRVDEWLLYDQGTPTTSGGRGLAYGFLYTHDGRLAVTVVQEGLVRKMGKR